MYIVGRATPISSSSYDLVSHGDRDSDGDGDGDGEDCDGLHNYMVLNNDYR